MKVRSVLRWLVLAGGLGACDAGTTPMGGPDGGGPWVLDDPAPPAAPSAVSLAPCPTGWREEGVGDATVCQPWATDSAPHCGAGELALAGVGCEAIDTCAADGWASDLPAAGVIYVRQDALGGDGSRAAPFATLREALVVRPLPTTIALAVGTYEGGVSLGAIALRGACATGTTITNPLSGLSDFAIELGERGHASGVHLVAGNFALTTTRGAHAEGQSLWLESAYGALRIEPDSVFVGDRLLVHANAPATSTPGDQCSVAARVGSSVTLRSSTITTDAVYAACAVRFDGEPVDYPPVELTFEGCAVLDTPIMLEGPYGHLTMRETVVERTSLVTVVPAGATAEATQVVIRDVAPSPGIAESASLASFGVTSVDRLFVSRAMGPVIATNLETGATTPGSLMAQNVVLDTTSSLSAISAQGGSQGVVHGLSASGLVGIVFDAEDGSVILATDVVAEIVGQNPAEGGDVAAVRAGGRIEITRARARVARAFAVAESGGVILATDIESQGGIGAVSQCVAERPCPEGQPSSITFTRASLHDMVRSAFALNQAHGELYDVDIDGVTGRSDIDSNCDVLLIHGTLVAERVRVAHTTSRALLLLGEGTDAQIRDLHIEDVAPERCDHCAAPENGDGLTCALGASGTVQEFVIDGARRGGLALVDDCLALSITHGVLSSDEIGVLTDTGGAHGVVLEDVRLEHNVNDFNTLELTIAASDVAL